LWSLKLVEECSNLQSGAGMQVRALARASLASLRLLQKPTSNSAVHSSYSLSLHLRHPRSFARHLSSTPVESSTSAAVSEPTRTIAGDGTGIVENAADAIMSAHVALSSDGQYFGWAVTLAATGVLVRAASAPLLYYAQVQNARALLAAHELGRIQAYLRGAPGSLLEKYQTFRRLRSVALRSVGTSPLRIMPWYVALNVPLFVTASLAVRRLAENAPDGWTTAGPAGWFPDLAAADPSGALPVINSVLWLLNAHTRARAAPKNLPPGDGGAGTSVRQKPLKASSALSGDWMTTAIQGVAVFAFPYMLDMPSGILLFWISSGVLTCVQRAVLSSDAGRLAIGLPTAANLAAMSREAGPPVLRATGGAVKAFREQLEYVRDDVLSSFAGRRVDDALRADVNKVLRKERARGRIGIDLEGVIRFDDDSGRKYLAVVRRGTADVPSDE
jgi:membrane protein insertase Oxa1/YidC/SpoIIIJ